MTRKEAINEIKSWAIPSRNGREVLETLIPELAESEDTRIRKELKEAFEAYDIESTWNGIPIRSIFSWLEKSAKSERVIKAARRVLNNWLDDTGCSDVSGDFVELEYAIRKYDGEEKQKEPDNKEGDFTIYHPQKNGKGKYECIPFSFYGSLTSFSEDKDLIDFLRTCFYTEEECNEWIKQQEEQEPLPPFDEFSPEGKMNHPLYLEGFDTGRKVQKVFDEQKPLPFSCGHENGKPAAEWAELRTEFNINEAFEDGKKEVIDHPDKYGLTKQKPVESIEGGVLTHLGNED